MPVKCQSGILAPNILAEDQEGLAVDGKLHKPNQLRKFFTELILEKSKRKFIESLFCIEDKSVNEYHFY